MQNQSSYIECLGVYGYNHVEPVILASLVTEDPLLLIGKAGTGKTFLLNSLSEALKLEHRHINASLVSFDDLIGFPYPDPDYTGIRYLETPASVWAAESVLVDEISRCKPEHQNRLFSLIYEKRIQGIKLEKLRYRWAAMNPCSSDQGIADFYDGSVPLDQALADRFAFILEVPDWEELDDTSRKLIADPRGDGVISDDRGALAHRLEDWKNEYQRLMKDVPEALLNYAMITATVLIDADLRISPRRVRQMVKNLVAVMAVTGCSYDEKAFMMTMQWSMPHRAWGITPKKEVIHAAHNMAWQAIKSDKGMLWLNQFHLERPLSKKVKRLIAQCPDEDTGTVAVTQTLARASKENAAAFSFALFPMALEGRLPIGREAINEMGKIASAILDLEGEIQWQERLSDKGTDHPEYARFAKVLSSLSGKRQERAKQLFYYLLINKIVLNSPVEYEKEFNRCITTLRSISR